MRVIGLIMRIFSLAFHFVLAVFMLAASSLAWSGGHALNLGMLPWQGAVLIKWVFFSGLAGLVILGLVAVKRLRVLFLVWNLVVLVMLVRGYFFSMYNFGPGGGSFSLALYVVGAALLAAAGSVFLMRSPRATVRREAALA